MRFRRVVPSDGYLFYNNIGAWDEDVLAEKCLEYGFIEIDKNLYLGNSKLNHEKLLQ